MTPGGVNDILQYRVNTGMDKDEGVCRYVGLC